MPYCSIHPKLKQGICYSCSNYKCCNPTEECTNQTSHLPFRGKWKGVPTTNCVTPVRKRKRTPIRACRRNEDTKKNMEEQEDVNSFS